MNTAGQRVAPTPFSLSQLESAWSRTKRVLPEKDCPYLNSQANAFLDKHVRSLSPAEHTKDSAVLFIIEHIAHSYLEAICRASKDPDSTRAFADLKKRLAPYLSLRPKGQARIIKICEYFLCAVLYRPAHCQNNMLILDQAHFVLNPKTPNFSGSLYQVSNRYFTNQEILLVAKALFLGLKELHERKKYFHLMDAMNVQVKLDQDGNLVEAFLIGACAESPSLKTTNVCTSIILFTTLMLERGYPTFLDEYVVRDYVESFLANQEISDLPAFKGILRGPVDLEAIYNKAHAELSKPTHTLKNDRRLDPFNSSERIFFPRDITQFPTSLFDTLNEALKVHGLAKKTIEYQRAYLGTFEEDDDKKRKIETGLVLPGLDDLKKLSEHLDLHCIVFKDGEVILETNAQRLDIPLVHISYDGEYFDFLTPQIL